MTGAARLATAAAMRAGAGLRPALQPGRRARSRAADRGRQPLAAARLVGRGRARGPRPLPGPRGGAGAGPRATPRRRRCGSWSAAASVPTVVDGDGLFALAWSPDGAVAVLKRPPRRHRPHPPRRRVRPAGRPAPGGRPPGRGSCAGRRRPVPSCCSRARPPSWPSRGAASSSRPRATSGWPPPARATCSPASSARCSPSRCRPFEAAAAGAWLHGSAGRRGPGARPGRLATSPGSSPACWSAL